MSDSAISHQLNSVRGAGSRKSQFLKTPAFWESSPSGASLEKLAALVRLPNACTSHPQRPYIPGFHNFAVDHDLIAPAELHSHSPCKHTDGTVIPPCEA